MGCTGQSNSETPGDRCQVAESRFVETPVIEYQIIVKEHLSLAWEGWFGGMHLNHTANGETIIRGKIPDQSALHGILAKVRDLNLTLLSLQRMNAN